ncbi:MAG: hypothetical protein JO001_12705 [Alphaproteobacteria bacterium]|nr:hypothetical protein [Alphaproteobacteria bacterium]
MKKFALAAALLASAIQPSFAACDTQSAREAEQAIRYVTDLMVVSSACRDTTYAEFRLRNKDQIISYQKAMITHLHGNAAFDKWNTSLANIAAQKQAGLTTTQVCQQQATMLKQASLQDPKAFRAYVATQVTSPAAPAAVAARSTKCR